VLDEGHRVRNMDTLTAKALRSVQRGNVLLLTGAVTSAVCDRNTEQRIRLFPSSRQHHRAVFPRTHSDFGRLSLLTL